MKEEICGSVTETGTPHLREYFIRQLEEEQEFWEQILKGVTRLAICKVFHELGTEDVVRKRRRGTTDVTEFHLAGGQNANASM